MGNRPPPVKPGSPSRLLGTQAVHWLAFAPPAAFLLFVARTFPTRHGLLQLVRDSSPG